MHGTGDPHPATRPLKPHRRTGPGALTPEQLARALALRAASEEGLSIREAVDLAAVQLGLEAPRLEGDN